MAARGARAADGKLPTIGFLGSARAAAQSQWTAAFVQRLRELGWIEGRTVAIEYRWAEGRTERFAEIAAEFVRLKVDVIVTHGTLYRSSQQSRRHRSIPIVFATAGTRLAPVSSRAWRDRAATSPACRASNPILPASGSNSCARSSPVCAGWRSWPMSTIRSPRWRWARFSERPARSASKSPQFEIRRAEDIAPAFEALKGRAEALYVVRDPLMFANRVRINTLALAARLPTMYLVREYVEAGGLMSYGPNCPDLFRRAAEYVDKILRGAKPADLPVEQPTKFDLVINLTTAKALGLDSAADAARPRRRGDRMNAARVARTFRERTPMKLPHRRQFLHLASGAVALPALSRIASAQTYPTRPVRLVVGFAAGQAIDILARLIAQSLSERFGQQFVVENWPGGGGNIATEAVVRAPPDGYTLLAVGSNNMINATLYEKLNFDFIRDIALVASIYRVPQVMEVNPSFPAKTLPELVAYAKANPGKINFASAGNGSVAHVTAELFKMMAGVNMQHVPYRGAAPALTDLLGGQVHLMFDNMPSSIEHIRAGRLRPLAVTATARLEGLPDVPTVADFLPGFETSAWAGIGAPKNTPAEIIDQLNRETNAALADPKLKARVADLGGMVFPLSPAEYEKRVAEETEKWGKVVKFSGARPD